MIFAIALCITLLCSAFFSAAETAFTALSDMQIRILQARYPIRGKLLFFLHTHSSLLLGTILVGNNAANFIFSVVSTALTLELFGNKALAIMTGIMILLTLIFGEITPKQLAFRHNQQYITLFIFPLFCFFILFSPLAYVLGVFSKIFSKSITDNNKNTVSELSKEHFIKLFYQARATGVLDTDNVHMITRILSISELTITQIITHRTEIISLASHTTIQDARESIKDSTYSYFPVYHNDDTEHIIGIVEYKDIQSFTATPSSPITDSMSLPIFITENKTIEKVLEIFQKSEITFAVVLDEYGGLEGIVTLTDIIYYICNLTQPSYLDSKESSKWITVDENSYLIDGTTEINKLAEIVGIPPEAHIESKTVGGYLQQHLSELPAIKKTINTVYGTMQVIKIKNNRITSILWIPNTKIKIPK